MKRKFMMLLTMISIICLCAFTPLGSPAGKKEPTVTGKAVSLDRPLGRPAVKITYLTEFNKKLLILLKKKYTSTNKPVRVAGPVVQYWWWDFSGNYIQQWDPSCYYFDSDNFPDCTTVMGSVYCEIRAPISYNNPEEPDLQQIVGSRFVPLP